MSWDNVSNDVKSDFWSDRITSIMIGVVALLLVNHFRNWLRQYLILKRIPGPNDLFPPWFMLRHYGLKVFTCKPNDATYEFANFFRNVIPQYSQNDEGIVKTFMIFEPFVVISSAESVESVLSDSSNLTKAMTYDFLDKYMGGSLLTSHGDLWRFQRKLTTPAFHFRILDDYMSVFNKHSVDFVKYLENHPKPEEVRLFTEISKCTLNIIGETTLGFDLGALGKENTYGNCLSKLQFLTVARSFRPWMWWDLFYFNFTEEGKMADECIRTMHAMSSGILKKRKAEALQKQNTPDEVNDEESSRKLMSFLDIILKEHLKDPKKVTEELVRAEVDTMLFAGQDTTSTSVAWTAYLLGIHPDIQEKCRQEAFDVLGNDPSSYVNTENLKQLKYMEAVLKEAMRVYTPFPIIGRRLESDLKVKCRGKKGGYTLPAGVQVMISLHHLHQDPKYFPEPEKFIPERFLDEKAPHKAHPFAYIPFSGGVRNCIGQKFAFMEVKVILAHMLRNFSWTSNWPRERIKVCFEIVSRAKGDVRVAMKPLRKEE